ncbi:unnamed protein product [Schistocephalus solidus]|uniref:Uncharacterized protein n=1 Tax=Schistocephalus solidus TaxID=70667 RepID=A0A183S9T1_SCHSO|nr:unnamed protein product [Schistocephalus solidus]
MSTVCSTEGSECSCGRLQLVPTLTSASSKLVLPSGHTPGNHHDRRAKPGEGLRCCVCLHTWYVCSLPPALSPLPSSHSPHYSSQPTLLSPPTSTPSSPLALLSSSLSLSCSSPLPSMLPFPLSAFPSPILSHIFPLSLLLTFTLTSPPLLLPSSSTVEKVQWR